MSAGAAGRSEKPPTCPVAVGFAALELARGREQTPPMALRGTSCIAGWTITPPGLGDAWHPPFS